MRHAEHIALFRPCSGMQQGWYAHLHPLLSLVHASLSSTGLRQKQNWGQADLGSCFNLTNLCYMSSIKPLNLSWEMGRDILTSLGSLCS